MFLYPQRTLPVGSWEETHVCVARCIIRGCSALEDTVNVGLPARWGRPTSCTRYGRVGLEPGSSLGTRQRTAHWLVGVHDRCAANSHIRCRSGMGGVPQSVAREGHTCSSGRCQASPLSVPVVSRGGVVTVPRRRVNIKSHEGEECTIGDCRYTRSVVARRARLKYRPTTVADDVAHGGPCLGPY